MKRNTILLATAALGLIASTASARVVNIEPVGQFADALGLTTLSIFDARPGKGVVTDNKHPEGQFYSGSVCMNELELVNESLYTKSVKVQTFDKSPSPVLLNSHVEVLNPGDSLNILDTGRAGDNVVVYRFDGTNGLDASTPKLVGSTGGDNCTSTGMTVLDAGEGGTSLGFKQGNDMIVRVALQSVTTNTDGTVKFSADLTQPLALGRGWSFPPTFTSIATK